MLTTPMGLRKSETTVTVTITKQQLRFLEQEAAEQALTVHQLITKYIRKGQMAALWGEPLHVYPEDIAV